jgi:hypothetical protein
MKSAFKDRVFRICETIASACFFLGVFALLVWAVYTGGLFRWLYEVFSFLWGFAATGGIIFAAVAFSIQRDRRFEKSLDAEFEEQLGELYEPVEKDPAWKPDPNRREALLAKHHAELSCAEATRWKDASTYWMLATGCALASLFMLAVTAWRCVRGLP